MQPILKVGRRVRPPAAGLDLCAPVADDATMPRDGGSSAPAMDALRIGEYVFDPCDGSLAGAGRALRLPPLTARLLACLARHAPQVVDADTLLAEVWPGRVIADEGIKQRVKLLRRALGDDAAHPRLVGSVRGVGYRLLAPVTRVDAGPVATLGAPALPRLLVLPFEVATPGAPAAVTACLAAAWLGDRLLARGGMEVVSPLAVAGLEEPPMALARRFGAGWLIGGSLDDGPQGRALGADLVDAVDGRLVRAMRRPPEADGDLRVAVDAIAQQVETALAIEQQPALAAELQPAPSLPRHEAYERYAEGMRHFVALRFDAAQACFDDARRCDAAFAAAYLAAAFAAMNRGRPEVAAARLAMLGRSASPLSPMQRHERRRLACGLRGDLAGALQAADAAARIAPHSPSAFDACALALLANAPRRAVAGLHALHPEAGFLAGWLPYWYYLCAAHHLCGDHASEHSAARRAAGAHPGRLAASMLALPALAALGRADEIDAQLGLLVSMPDDFGHTAGTAAALAARELAAHGHAALSRDLARRAAAWLDAEAPSPQGLAERFAMHLLLGDAGGAGRWLQRVTPGSLAPSEVAGMRALVAAIEGGAPVPAGSGATARAGAARPRVRDAGRRAAYRAPFWHATAAAWRGAADEALAALRQARALGHPRVWPHMDWHADPALRPLWGTQGFARLMQPDG